MAALASIQVLLAVVILGYEIIDGRLARPLVLFLIAGLIVLGIERRRRLAVDG